MADENSQQSHNNEERLHELKRDAAYREHDRWNIIYEKKDEAAIKTSESFFKATILINGGAAISILAFIGGIASKEIIKIDRLTDITNSLLIFAGGVACAAIGIGLAYCIHYLDTAYNNSYERILDYPYLKKTKNTPKICVVRNIVHVFAFLAGIFSIVCFIYGMFSVKDAIIHINAPLITLDGAKK